MAEYVQTQPRCWRPALSAHPFLLALKRLIVEGRDLLLASFHAEMTERWESQQRLASWRELECPDPGAHLQQVDCSHPIWRAMDLKLQMRDFNRPSSDQRACGSSRPPLGCHWSIHIHSSRASLPIGKVTVGVLLLFRHHDLCFLKIIRALDTFIARPPLLVTMLLTSNARCQITHLVCSDYNLDSR